MDAAPLVVARALLLSASGDRPGIDLPISAANAARLAPAPQAVEAVVRHFESAGFTILGKPGATIGIAGPKELFERCFGVGLELRADQAYGVLPAQPVPHKAGSRRPQHPPEADDPTLVPADRLPQAIRQAISQIALEAAVSADSSPGADA